jgi:SAM-dependent methyltransferase
MTDTIIPTQTSLARQIELIRPDVKTVIFEDRYPATEAMFNRLTDRECEQIQQGVAAKMGVPASAELISWKTRSFPHYRREILRLGSVVSPELFAGKIRLIPKAPPADVHSMIRQEHFVGDLYSCDMAADAVLKAGYTFEDGKEYLEFGCSSGPMLRTLSAAYPAARWTGCDPVPVSIDWAADHFPWLKLSTSPQSPPLAYPTASFAGAMAISIWSHFSERAGIAWFTEMHRVLAPNAFLMFTTHGYRSLYYYLTEGMRDPRTIGKLVDELASKQYAFHPIFKILEIEDSGLQLEDWGDCYLSSDWVHANLSRQWELMLYEPGRNQMNQDVYVLKRSA